MCLFTNHNSYSAWIMVPLHSFDLTFFLHNRVSWRFAVDTPSVQDIKIGEALLILCLAYYVMKRVRHCWNWGAMPFTYRDIGRTFPKHILCIFCNGWMDCRDAFHALLILLCNGQDIAEYETYWLMGFPIISLWGARFTSVFSIFSVMAGWIAETLFMLLFAYIAV